MYSVSSFKYTHGSTGIEWRSHAPSGRAHGTYEIEKYEWVSMERKLLFSGHSLYMPWITHMLFVDLNDNFSCKDNVTFS